MPYSEKDDIRGDGRIVLYKRTDLKNPKWQARISVPNATGYKVISTKTTDHAEARRFAMNLYEKLFMQVMAGGALNSKTFKQVFEEWKEHATTVGVTRSDGSWESTIKRVETYALPFFGPKRIDEIREGNFTEYWAWRKANYNKKAPTNDTLKRERTCIVPVFKFALSKGYVAQIPSMNAPNVKGGRRPTFSRAEWRAIEKSIPLWVKESEGRATWRDRFMAQHCFAVLAYSGIRIGELRNLRWRDLNPRKTRQADGSIGTYLSIHVRGKTGKREVIGQPGIEVSFKKILIQRCKELSLANPEKEDPQPKPDEAIFCHPDGRPIKDYKHSFQSLLDFAGVPAQLDGKKRTIYSLRHLYATWQLSREVSPFLLARQMGTSVEMLEKHYGQVITSTVAAQITKAKPSSIIVEGEMEFPF